MEFSSKWWVVRETAGAGISAAITVAVFLAAPVLAFLMPVAAPTLAEVVARPPRAPVYLEVPALALQADPGEEDPVEVLADSTVDSEQTGEADTVEQLASTAEGPGDEISEGGESGVAGMAGSGTPTGQGAAPTEPQIDKVVKLPMMTLRIKTPPRGANGERIGPAVTAISAGPGLRARSRGRRSRCKDNIDDVFPQPDGSFEVNRTLVEYYTSSIKNFNSLGYSGPYNEEGVRGWKIGGFGCNSPLHFAGLRRGDIIRSVNGRNTNTWLQVFGAYTKLKRHNVFRIVLIRRGKPMELEYRLI